MERVLRHARKNIKKRIRVISKSANLLQQKETGAVCPRVFSTTGGLAVIAWEAYFFIPKKKKNERADGPSVAASRLPALAGM